MLSQLIISDEVGRDPDFPSSHNVMRHCWGVSAASISLLEDCLTGDSISTADVCMRVFMQPIDIGINF
jgi:hypothetical protein